MNNPEGSINNAGTVEKQVQAAIASNPSLARELATFLLDKTPDSQPVTKEEHPVFFDATKNPGTYHYVPKSGIGVHKDGTKFTAFDYEVSFHTRSKDFFGEDIEKAKEANDIYALKDIIFAAYGDLVISGNDDMTSYLYLCREAVHSLSEKVKEEIGDLQYEGGVALALVTELVATSSTGEELFKIAVAPRKDDAGLSGIEAMNEANVVRVYTALTPSVQTKGILLRNNVDVNRPWAQTLIQKSPNLDNLVSMNFDTLTDLLPSVGADAISKPDLSVIHQMYSGMLGQPMAADIPPVRRYVLENGLNLGAAQKLEEDGYNDLSIMTDKDIYNVSTSIKELLNSDLGGKSDDLSTVTSKLMRARQDSMNYNLSLNANYSQKFNAQYSQKFNATTKYNMIKETMPMGDRLRGKGGIMTKAASLLRKGGSAVSAGATAQGASSILAGFGGSISASASGATGMSASMASAASAASMAGPAAAAATLALTLAPVLNRIAEDNRRELNKDMAETAVERQNALAEVTDLVARVSDISTTEDLDERQAKAKEFLAAVNRPGSFAFSKMQGMGLQRQLEAMGTQFTPSAMTALPPYQNDADLVAAVDSGRALSAVCIFLERDTPIAAPDRQLLQTPRYVKMMGSSQPFQTRTHRTTSEKESMTFTNSASQSGFSMAEKCSSSSSNSNEAKGGWWPFAGKVKSTKAEKDEDETNFSYANDAKHKKEEKVKVTQAIVSEFTFMPMQTFSLSAGGLVLSDYAYYRLQKITEESDPAIIYKKCLDFLIDFGSHIPFGVQTLGGVFIRKMIINSREAASVTEMYSAASCQLTKTNSDAASGSLDVGVQFGGGVVEAGANNSRGVSSAAANGNTTVVTSSAGEGSGDKSISASFQSSVTCYGPNAATQDMMHQQLMTNNRTWTIIDRGEPGSYFAIWDLIDYIGQGTIFSEQCKYLKNVWEDKALLNSPKESELLKTVMTNYDLKKRFFDFVGALIDTIVPTNGSSGGIFTGALADQFEEVVRAAVSCQQSRVSNNPIEFIDAGFASLSGTGTLSGTKRKLNSEPERSVRKFKIIAGTPAYRDAKKSLMEFTSLEWVEFSYYSALNRLRILEKGKPNFLLDICSCLSQDTDWIPLIRALISPPKADDRASDVAVFEADLDSSLQYKESATGKNCLHYVLSSKDKTLIGDVFKARPANILMKDDKGKTPLMLASDSIELESIFNHLQRLSNIEYSKNIAKNRRTSQSSTDTRVATFHSKTAVNGNIQSEVDTPNSHEKNITHTKKDNNPWWQVELLESKIYAIGIHNRATGSKVIAGRLKGFRVEVFNGGKTAAEFTYDDNTAEGEVPADHTYIDIYKETNKTYVEGDRVKVSIPRTEILSLREVEVWGTHWR